MLDDREDSEYESNVRYLRHPPKVVLIQFTDRIVEDETLIEEPCQWTLDGMSDPGVHPIKPWRCKCFSDQKREKPMLSVKRWQVPLGSIYALSKQDYCIRR